MKTNGKRIIAVIAATSLTLSFCNKPLVRYTETDSKEVPNLPETPIDYPASKNDYLAALGRVLFYDKELSINKNIACASCHQQEHAFTDSRQFSPGTNNVHTLRNTPSIFSREGRLFWDGRTNSFPDLALRPVTNDIEMGITDVNLLTERIASLDYYQAIFDYAFPRMSKQAVKIDSNMFRIALAEFMKNFNFSNNKFAKVRNGEDQFTPSEQIGKDLFFGRANCSQCHHVDPSQSFNGGGNGGYGSTNEFHNIGLDDQSKDLGVGAISKIPQQNGSFMMPVLLNIEYTAPYMHDGRFSTLEEVVEHYNSDIKDNPDLDPILRGFNGPIKLNLTDAEKKGLVDFLKTLSDPSILTDERFSNPFVPR
jgi:cytochrome c peroxidase